ncbi:MAG TPA: hypothetical protein VGN57_00585 [Pirellulaceae bacterium]|jgi:hypothetical protein|nr:hypothetical protein [Pirellulaceae bacterium]
MSDARRNAAAIAVVFLLLAPALYVGSYAALLNPSESFDYLGKPGVVMGRHPRFYVDHRWLDSAYWPLIELDRLLRPGYWNPGLELGASATP